MSLWVPRGSGLVERFTPPELTLEAAVERSWRRRAGGRLLEPKPDEGPWLQTYPLPGWHGPVEAGWEMPAELPPGWLFEWFG